MNRIEDHPDPTKRPAVTFWKKNIIKKPLEKDIHPDPTKRDTVTFWKKIDTHKNQG